MRARIRITLKDGVLDPQGQAIEKSLHTLGFEEAGNVRQGKVIELDIAESDEDRARARLDEMCRRLLANTVIENYEIELTRT